MDLRIDRNLIEQPQIAKWAVQFTGKNWSKIDYLLRLIVKPYPQREI
jgi:hypothetical protein